MSYVFCVLNVPYSSSNSKSELEPTKSVRFEVFSTIQVPDLNVADYRVVRTDPDGNCLFRAFSVVLYGTQAHYKELRRDGIKYIEDNRQTFHKYVVNDFEEYVTSQKNLGE